MTMTSYGWLFEFGFWFLALVYFVIGVYIILLNAGHRANRRIGALMLIFSANAFGLSLMYSSFDASQATLPTFLVAVTMPAISPMIALVILVLLKPDWLTGKFLWLRMGLYFSVFLPTLLAFCDLAFGTHFWYIPPLPETYSGGYLMWNQYVGGVLFIPVLVWDLMAIPVITWGGLIYQVRRVAVLSPMQRSLAWILLVLQSAILLIEGGVRHFSPGFATVAVSLMCVTGYTYIVMRGMIPEERVHRGWLRTRLLLLLLATTVPVVVISVGLVLRQAWVGVVTSTHARMETFSQVLSSNVTTWLDANVVALRRLAASPEIKSMDPAQQEPYLKMAQAASSYSYLVSTVSLEGVNVARSDGRAAVDYSDRDWFTAARRGRPLTYQVLRGRTVGAPALVISVPITDSNGAVVGVLMSAGELTDLSKLVAAGKVGETGLAYVVDDLNRLVLHSDIAATVTLPDYSSEYPVRTLRMRKTNFVQFSDLHGERWWAYAVELPNGWAIVVQQSERELLWELRQLQWMVWVILGLGVILCALVVWLTIYRAFLAIFSLTETATAIAAGDLGRQAQVEGDDEIGLLAQSFNSMTAQLREAIGGLENRVALRTRELERRAEYLAATGEVSRVAASILEVDLLLNRTATLIADRFRFYHVGIFLFDNAREWAVLRAASSEGGQRMLANGYRVRVGERDLVGQVALQGRARISAVLEENAAALQGELPATRSQIALPLLARGGQIIGVLDVHSTTVDAFSTDDVAILRILADQLGIAIVNARLFRDNQRALEELRRLYGQESERGWLSLQSDVVGFRYDASGVHEIRATEAEPLRAQMALQLQFTGPARTGTGPLLERNERENTLLAPLRFAGGTLGMLRLQRNPERPWTRQEMDFIAKATSDMSQALENARLLSEARARAARDHLVSEVGGQLRASLDPDFILQATVRELGRVLGAELTLIEVAPGGK